MVRVGHHAVEELFGLLHPSHGDEAVDEPEGTEEKGPLAAGQAVLGPVTVEEPLRTEFPLNGLNCRDDARVIKGEKPSERYMENTCIEGITAVVPDKRLLFLTPPLFYNLISDSPLCLLPSVQIGGKAVPPRNNNPPVEGDPAHEL